MAQGTKGQTAATAAPTNGVTHGHPPAPVGVNRKKQKRREKQAARQAASQGPQQDTNSRNGHLPHGQSSAHRLHPHSGQQAPDYGDHEFDDQSDPGDGEYYSDEDEPGYGQAYGTNGHYQSDYAGDGSGTSKNSKKKKKKKSRPLSQNSPHNAPSGRSSTVPPPLSSSIPPPPPPPPQAFSNATLRTVQRGANSKDRIWNTSTSEERERIKEFWLSLGEDERKSLVKIEKEAVLRKMKEQQKHSCSCTVCGRKRTAIEEELEVLYDAYYEELEQYANHQQDNGGPMLPPPSRYSHPMAGRTPPDRMPHMMNPLPPPRIRELAEDESEEDDEDEGDEEDYSEDEDEDDYSDDEPLDLPRGAANDFFNFGNSLTVKGGILTVADDLLKNDGKKFIEMMEQLAERRMQREEEAQYAAAGLSHPNPYSKAHTSHSHGAPPEDDEYDDEEDEEYDDDDEEYEDDEEVDTMTEEQRMEEGRRMFQIFAARMFEQRVLTAYREKVAAERQAKLLEELEEESRLDVQREAKRAREAQKKKDKKEKQKQAKAEEKARKDAEKAAEEAAAKAAEEKKQEEQRRKKEEQRKKKEAERKAQEEERQRKEAERQKRLQEERERQQEAERKLRDQKAQEKKARDEAKRKEREEREAREKEARDKKAQEDKERREREARAKAEKERARKDDQAASGSQGPASTVKRPNQPVAVALPPGLLSKQSSTGFPSPHVQVATPAIPKAPTPVRPRQSSQQGSHGSSPKTPQVAPGTGKSMSPSNSVPQMQNAIAPKTILTKPQNMQQPLPLHHPQPSSPMPPMGPPPGMQPPSGIGLVNMPPGLNGFPHNQAQMMPGMMGPRHSLGHNMPMFPPQPGSQFRSFAPPGMPGPAPGMPLGRGFSMDGPPGFAPPIPGIGANQMTGFGIPIASHSRQQSASFDKPNIEPPIVAPQAQPIARPAPIQRPSSVKPHEGPQEIRRQKGDFDEHLDELADHLGSKALLDDADDTLPEFSGANARRASTQAGGMSRNSRTSFNFAEGPNQPRSDSYAPFGGSNGLGSAWSTPSMPFAPTWGNSPTSGMFNNGFMMGNQQAYPTKSRLVQVRRMVCQACRILAARKKNPDGFFEVGDVYHQIEAGRSPTDVQVKLDEIVEVCDILGDSSNGGGTLNYKELDFSKGRYAVKFEESGGPTAELGEIGSPLPNHSVPAASGFGARPFAPLGPISSSNF
ncbi:hypothetical protein K432DRAFT_387952 [Lepidopterella palustris CBS 459.81]|uniref:Stress response protein NST1 n=1 Tax=Lepidopterella palustris CBS 459.81 TaxID=1314670 RepID=A0A8E2EML6_9PEZI|nr:hypothetical protein K432DRAFT_387952 [Lepidopterella palustris CBS 459.81]